MSASPGTGTSRSQRLHTLAARFLPGAVCASARFNPAIGRPFFVSRGEGAHLYDLDGKPYIDLCMSHGASLLGHRHPKILAAVQQALELGVLCACETEHQTALAQRLSELVPCAQMTRFGGSGTETVMHGLRLARHCSGREKVIKFEGHFHGYSDALNFSVMPPLERAGSAAAPLAVVESSGVPVNVREHLIVLPFNDPQALQAAFAAHGDQVAALLVEPINYDQGCIEPQPGFLQLCRSLCDRHGTLLFFDEVLTAFRLAPGGAQQLFGVRPDLCVLGKALGAGMPISALVGRRELMSQLMPLGASQMSGTYLAHLTAVLAATQALQEYSQADFYARLNATADHFYAGFQGAIERSGVALRLQHAGPRFGLYFGVREPVQNYRQAARKSQAAELDFIASCHARGLYLQPSAHHGFSAAHGRQEIDQALSVIEDALLDVKRLHPAL